MFIGRTDAEAETPILWPTDAKSRLIRKDPRNGDLPMLGTEPGSPALQADSLLTELQGKPISYKPNPISKR